MGLQEELDKARAEIKTDSYPMSIGEWLSLYTGGELEIHPEFQRFYRWTQHQKSLLIESIMLGIPIPPIFVAQTEEGVWDVVDGLQRLSTLFEFMGVLRDENGETSPPLVLQGTKYLPSLESKVWEDAESPDHSFTQAQRLYVKRAKLDVSIILRESDEKAKFELFQRLNSGGSPLSAQEMRNCIIVMLNRDFYPWLLDLATNEDFLDCIAVTDKAVSEQYHVELALRFLIFKQMEENDLKRIRDVGEFITDKMIGLIQDATFDQQAEAEIFRATFSFLAATIGANAFRRYDPKRQNFFGGFILSAFEVIALSVGYYGGDIGVDAEELTQRVRDVWSNHEFKKWSGSGVRASQRIPVLIPLGRRLFEP